MRDVSKTTRSLVFERDGRVCRVCGATEHVTIDHIVPRSRGGTNAPENLQVLCGYCNRRKGDAVPVTGKTYALARWPAGWATLADLFPEALRGEVEGS